MSTVFGAELLAGFMLKGLRKGEDIEAQDSPVHVLSDALRQD